MQIYVYFLHSRLSSKGGLKKEAFTKSKTGKIVSKKKSAAGKKAYKQIAGWK